MDIFRRRRPLPPQPPQRKGVQPEFDVRPWFEALLLSSAELAEAVRLVLLPEAVSGEVVTPAIAQRTLAEYLMAYDFRDAELRAVLAAHADQRKHQSGPASDPG